MIGVHYIIMIIPLRRGGGGYPGNFPSPLFLVLESANSEPCTPYSNEDNRHTLAY